MSAVDDAANALQQVIANLSGPQSVSSDAGTVTSQPIPDQIQAANYLAGIAAATTRGRGLRFNTLRPGGTVQGVRRYPQLGNGREW